jgi:hypothetical protein
MQYEKPEIAVLGDAASLIQGSKNLAGDQPSGGNGAFDCELDD